MLIIIFLVVVIALGWFLSVYFGSSDILYIAIAFAFFQVFFSYWFSHKIVLSMTGAREVKREEHRDLWNVVENLSITAGLPMPKLYIITDGVPNAFATGRNQKHAVVAVTTGLLERLDRTELEGVIAHELSHIGNKDMLISTLIVVLVGFITLLSDMFLRAQLFGGNRDNERSGGGQIQLALMVLGVVLMILSPLIATLIQLSISRKREFLADASGALLTRYPEGLASALEKISSSSGKMQKANHATAHLFISSPFGKTKKAGWFESLWATHPPVEERVNRLRGSDISS
ncbi:MAG: Protease HtpX [Patescibacteria group bacterium]|nr:Protease HtpX [Patescibacteria group bacterium]